MDREAMNESSGRVVKAARYVHSVLRPGLLESAYQACLAHELRKRGATVLLQVPVPLVYDGVSIDVCYYADMIVDGVVLVELKAVEKLLPVHTAQLLSYLRLTQLKVGLLINFHAPYLKQGIKRLVNDF